MDTAMEAVRNELMKMFLCFPGAQSMERETVMATLAAYLETLSSFSPEIVGEACQSYRKRATRFPPTAGELYDRCSEIQHKAIQARKQLPPPDKPERSDEERARMQQRFQALLAELKATSAMSGPL